jgi:hypothetical protein
MTERRYTDEEVAAIFERASKAENAALAGPVDRAGLTLSALQDIGREVGISPESISLAAQSLDLAGRSASQRFMGLPIGVGRTVEFDRPLSDADWESLVADLRTTFAARGVVRYDGPFRQWTNGNLQALVEPTATGHRLRLQTVKGASRRQMTVGVVVMGAAAATLLADAVIPGLGQFVSVPEMGMMASMGLALFAAGALRLGGWARRRRTEIEEVIARLAARTQEPPQTVSSSDGDTPRIA